MLHRVKKENDLNRDKWVGIGGKFEDGESPEECNAREVFEETGLTLQNARYRGILTFVSDRWENELIHLFTADSFSGKLTDDCDEGRLEWIDKRKLLSLPMWQGDRIFLRLIANETQPFFSLKLVYRGELLVSAVLDGKVLGLTDRPEPRAQTGRLNICVYGAASDLIDSSYRSAGEALGEALAAHGHRVIFGGGAAGMMGAVARGAKRRGGELTGISPTFFRVDGALFGDCDDFLYTETMRERKRLLEEQSDGFLVTPGGIGTLDELFEILSLRQLGRHRKPILLYNINGYFDPLLALLRDAARQRFIKEENLSLLAVEADPESAVRYFETYTARTDAISDYR